MKIVLVGINSKYIHTNLAVRVLKKYAEMHMQNKAADTYEALESIALDKYTENHLQKSNTACEKTDAGQFFEELNSENGRKYKTDSPIPEIQIIENTVNRTKEECLRSIYESSPDVLCFSCYIWNIDFIMEIISDIKKIKPETEIWLGGPEVSYSAYEILKKNKNIKGVMTLEGEETFKDLVLYYMSREKNGPPFDVSLKGLKGITYRENEIILTNPPCKSPDMDEIPFAYDEYELRSERIIYYESSRGCPFSCSYCLSSINQGVRTKSLDIVKKDLQYMLSCDVKIVKFVDRTFNANADFALAVWKYIIEHDNGKSTFHFEIGADLLNEKMLEVLSSARKGLIQIEAGVQSTNIITAEKVFRRTDFTRLKNNVKTIHSFGNIHEHLDLIAGLPYETYESFKKSFDDTYDMEPDCIQLGFLKVLHGTRMEEDAKEYGIVYSDKPPYEVLSTLWLSYEEILRLKRVEEIVEIYNNSSQFRLTVKTLVKREKSAFMFFYRMSLYFEEKGYFSLASGRVEKYERLCGFIKDTYKESAPYDLQVLTWDYYSWENAKKRPDFTVCQDNYKEYVRDFYSKEKHENRLFPEYRGITVPNLMNKIHLEIFTIDVISYVNHNTVKNMFYPVCFTYDKKQYILPV